MSIEILYPMRRSFGSDRHLVWYAEPENRRVITLIHEEAEARRKAHGFYKHQFDYLLGGMVIEARDTVAAQEAEIASLKAELDQCRAKVAEAREILSR